MYTAFAMIRAAIGMVVLGMSIMCGGNKQGGLEVAKVNIAVNQDGMKRDGGQDSRTPFGFVWGDHIDGIADDGSAQPAPTQTATPTIDPTAKTPPVLLKKRGFDEEKERIAGIFAKAMIAVRGGAPQKQQQGTQPAVMLQKDSETKKEVQVKKEEQLNTQKQVTAKAEQVPVAAKPQSPVASPVKQQSNEAPKTQPKEQETVKKPLESIKEAKKESDKGDESNETEDRPEVEDQDEEQEGDNDEQQDGQAAEEEEDGEDKKGHLNAKEGGEWGHGERHPPNGIVPEHHRHHSHRHRSRSQSHHGHKPHHHRHQHHHNHDRRRSSSHHECGCHGGHHHGCRKPCKVEDLKRCTFEQSGLTLIKTKVPYCQAEQACRAFGMYLAEVTINNWVDVTNVAFQCNGPFTSSWIRSWNGDLYLSGESANASGTVPIGNNTAKACLTLDTGNSAPGGAVTVPATCDIEYPVLCQRQLNKDALQPQQEQVKPETGKHHCGCKGNCRCQHHKERRRRTSTNNDSGSSSSSDEELTPRRNTSLLGSEHNHNGPTKALKGNKDHEHEDDDSTDNDDEHSDNNTDSNDDEEEEEKGSKSGKVVIKPGGVQRVVPGGENKETVGMLKLAEKDAKIGLQAKQILIPGIPQKIQNLLNIDVADQKELEAAQGIPLVKRAYKAEENQHQIKQTQKNVVRNWKAINQGMVEFKQSRVNKARKHPHGPVSVGEVAQTNKRLIAVNQGMRKAQEKLIVIPHPHI